MPMITEAKPVVFDDSLPERVDVVVIGAGVVGTATAYYLAQAGVQVLLCEKAAWRASSRAATGAGSASRAGTGPSCRS